jgi:uncharacterized membrane protein (DUF373 family)
VYAWAARSSRAALRRRGVTAPRRERRRRAETGSDGRRCARIAAEDPEVRVAEQLGPDDEPLIRGLHWVIRMAVRALAILMTGVIVFGVADVVYVLYQRLMADPRGFLQISDILATFGAFMAVLIAIEIFVNIISYLRDDVIHVRIVVATALMAIARKVIILDYSTTSSEYVYATAAVVAAMALAYWLVVRQRPADVTGAE